MLLYCESDRWCIETDGIIRNDEAGNYILASAGQCLVKSGCLNDFWTWRYTKDTNKARYTLSRLKVYEDRKGLFVKRYPYGKFYVEKYLTKH